jgi:predicted glycoside hydrolase/deacetylase ChbG (UPF0249 family)
MARSLIVNADDFGLSPGVSRGIIRAHREGIVSSTTFMVNLPWAEEMVRLLEEAPDLGVGIHLNLTTGRPVLPPEQVPSLVTGRGDFSSSLLRLFSRSDPEEVKREWAAQVQRGIELLGRLPTHLDTHKYLQGHPAFAEAMVEVARRFSIPAVRCLYPRGLGATVAQMFGTWSPARLVIDRYLTRSAEVVARSGLKAPQAILAGDFDLPGLLRKLEWVGEGITELVTHPGEVDGALHSLSSLLDQREVELAALTSPEARRKLEELGIQLISFRELAA